MSSEAADWMAPAIAGTTAGGGRFVAITAWCVSVAAVGVKRDVAL